MTKANLHTEKLSLTVGIIAYNEENSIKQLLLSLKFQKTGEFKFDHIIIISDGSTDSTVNVSLSIRDNRIKVINDPIRKGKSQQLNRMFKETESDILVLLDADITLKENTLFNLLLPFSKSRKPDLVSGKIVPFKIKSFTQKALNAGFELMDQAKKEVENNDAYSCTGQIRAMKKSLYKKIVFPEITAEDIYPFFYCVSQKLKYQTVNDAVVNYELPRTYKSFVMQMKRYLSAPLEHQKLFSTTLTAKYFTITPISKTKALLKRMLINPFWTAIYLIYLLIPKLLNLIIPYKNAGIWEVES